MNKAKDEPRYKVFMLTEPVLMTLIREAGRLVERNAAGQPLAHHLLSRFEPPLPDDAELYRVFYDGTRLAFACVIWSSTYPIVNPARMIPDDDRMLWWQESLSGAELAAKTDQKGRKPFEFLGRP